MVYNPVQQLPVVLQTQPAAVRGVQPQPAAARGVQPQPAAAWGVQPQQAEQEDVEGALGEEEKEKKDCAKFGVFHGWNIPPLAAAARTRGS